MCTHALVRTYGSHDGVHRDAGFYEPKFPSFAEFTDDDDDAPWFNPVYNEAPKNRDAIDGFFDSDDRIVLDSVHETRMIVYIRPVD